jgi:hypothetical protein
MIICVSPTFSGAIGLYRSDCAPYPELGQDHLNPPSRRQNGKDIGIKCAVTVIAASVGICVETELISF